MPKVLAFSARGRFAAHKDPSVTTHQLVYYAPPKSAIIGMVGAILGTPRSETGELYSPKYIELLCKIRVGIGMLNEPDRLPQKVLFGTNRRPLGKNDSGHMKPTKSELVENPAYRIYVSGDSRTIDELKRRIDNHDLAYPVYFGHAYCQARVEDARVGNAQKEDSGSVTVETTVLREDPNADYLQDGSVIVENKMVHRAHRVRDDMVERRSMPHMIPLRGTKINVANLSAEWQEFLCWEAGGQGDDAGVFSVF